MREVYNPSRIPTRAEPLEMDDNNSTISISDDTRLENDDSGLVTRPMTKRDNYTSYPKTSGTVCAPSFRIPTGSTSFLEKFSSGSQSSSITLNQRISRLIKAEKKMMKQKQELIKEISSWCNVLPNDDCKKLLYHFIKILETELEANDRSIMKKDLINSQLLNVNKREKRANELKLKRNKMMVKLRDNENKIGDSPITTLTKENLEELECSVDIVEDQFIRSINNGLKNAIVDYVMGLQEAGIKFGDNSKYFLGNYYFTSTKLNDSSNLQRLVLQNRLNSAYPHTSGSAILKEELHPSGSSSLNLLDKYNDGKLYGENDTETRNGEGVPSVGLTKSEYYNEGPSMLKVSNIDLRNSPNDHHSSSSRGSTILPGQNSNNNSINIQRSEGGKFGLDIKYNINPYNTPGSLAIRPGSQQTNSNHEWTT